MFRVRPYKFPGFGLAGLWHQTSYSGIDINETSKRFDGAVRKAEEPQTRQALHILRQSYDNTADFLLDLYNEEILQQKLEIVVMGLEPLHREFLGCSQANKKGPEHMLLWQGHHAAGGYMETCNAMIHNLLGAAELRLEGARGLDLNHPSAKRDTVLVWLYWSFTMELVGKFESMVAGSSHHPPTLPLRDGVRTRPGWERWCPWYVSADGRDCHGAWGLCAKEPVQQTDEESVNRRVSAPLDSHSGVHHDWNSTWVAQQWVHGTSRICICVRQQYEVFIRICLQPLEGLPETGNFWVGSWVDPIPNWWKMKYIYHI